MLKVRSDPSFFFSVSLTKAKSSGQLSLIIIQYQYLPYLLTTELLTLPQAIRNARTDDTLSCTFNFEESYDLALAWSQ